MKYHKLKQTLFGILAASMFALTGCSFNPNFGIPGPVVSEGTVYFYTLCEFNAVDAETGQVKWKKPTFEDRNAEHCLDKD